MFKNLLDLIFLLVCMPSPDLDFVESDVIYIPKPAKPVSIALTQDLPLAQGSGVALYISSLTKVDLLPNF